MKLVWTAGLPLQAWVASQTNQSLGDLERVVNKESGLLGISGLSSDLRVLEKAWHEGHERAQLAIKTFVHRIARHIAGHAASLRRLDGIIFTGENKNHHTPFNIREPDITP